MGLHTEHIKLPSVPRYGAQSLKPWDTVCCRTSLFTTKYVTFHVTVPTCAYPRERGSNIASLTIPFIPRGRSTPGSRRGADEERAGKKPRVHSRDSETAESARRMTHRHSPARKKRATRFDTHNKYVTPVRRMQASAKHTWRARGNAGCVSIIP